MAARKSEARRMDFIRSGCVAQLSTHRPGFQVENEANIRGSRAHSRSGSRRSNEADFAVKPIAPRYLIRRSHRFLDPLDECTFAGREEAKAANPVFVFLLEIKSC